MIVSVLRSGRAVALSVLVALTFAFTGAGCSSASNFLITCSASTVTIVDNLIPGYTYGVYATTGGALDQTFFNPGNPVPAGVTVIGSKMVSSNQGSTYPVTVTYPPQPAGTFITLNVETLSAGPSNTFITQTANCAGVTSFTANDGRINGQAADHLALYCALSVLNVYGINDQGSGFFLGHFNLNDLYTVGKNGLNLTAPNNGVLSASADPQGNLYVAWNGGQYHADGQINHGFAKSINCGSGDVRYNAQPQDRIAVYCNVGNSTVAIYGITDKGVGFFLTRFTNVNLKTAGSKGLAFNAGNNGVISAASDADGNLYIAWNGGQYQADGQVNHGFAKSVNCHFLY